MKFLPSLSLALVLGVAGNGFAATTTNTVTTPAHPAKKASAKPAAAPAPAPAPAKPAADAPVPEDPMPVPNPPTPAPDPKLKLDDYFSELVTATNLTDLEKKDVEGFYYADGTVLSNILNNDSLSPLQKAEKVSDLRDTRNAKIEALLVGTERKHAFLLVETKYRVALIELAADGGLVAPAPAK